MSTGTRRDARHPQHALRTGILAALLIGAASPAAQACQSCFGAEDSPLLDGARSGAWFLIAVTVAMQGAFAAFFIYLWRRSRRIGQQALRNAWAEPEHSSR